jgi:hypothetical protein
MPSGTAAKKVTISTSDEPTQADKIPAAVARLEGKFVKKSKLNLG